ncbi:MAG TPA: lipocalin family protein [Pedobacter sp.]|uniref:lipocalin family protein n=1 Tax=Pedobacter sp. TaxID=1411316 RepID=UPI002B81F837|nr:lipocalin family protein [Pedobacter sp.]HMI01939.1 lipocalin family protein [Pedobacter sp.]
MKIIAFTSIAILTLASCNQTKTNTGKDPLSITGTWKLVSSQAITKGDTVNTTPQNNVEMIKIINDTHFAFFQHDLNKGKDTTALYSSGSGTYTLEGDSYTEHLEYCIAREWEGHEFKFTVTLKKDTLIQRGIEKIENLNVNREITEIYIRK